MAEEVFFAHSRTWHCKILISEGQVMDVEDQIIPVKEETAADSDSNLNSVEAIHHYRLADNNLEISNASLDEETQLRTTGLKPENDNDIEIMDEFNGNLVQSAVSMPDTLPFSQSFPGGFSSFDLSKYPSTSCGTLPGKSALNHQFQNQYASGDMMSDSKTAAPSHVNKFSKSRISRPLMCKRKQKQIVHASASKRPFLSAKGNTTTTTPKTDSSGVQGDIERVTGFACRWCKKVFNSTAHVKRHERIHTGEKPYLCEICLKSFRHGWLLKSHIYAMHKR